MGSEKKMSPQQAVAEEFLAISRRQLKRRLSRIETCLDRLTEEQIWARAHEQENAVGNLVLHLEGNIRQWIISGIGQAPDQRDRDAEFSRREGLPTAELISALRQTVEQAGETLAALTSETLAETRTIQGFELTVLHAIYHVLEHFAEHTGQIIWATKRMTAEDLGFYRYLQQPGERGDSKHQP